MADDEMAGEEWPLLSTPDDLPGRPVELCVCGDEADDPADHARCHLIEREMWG